MRRRTAPRSSERYGLSAGEPVEGSTWRYELRDRSRENVGALVGDRAVADTAYIDRPDIVVPRREIHVGVERARLLVGPAPLQLVQVQSLLLFALAGTLLWAATVPDLGRRRLVAAAALLGVTLAAYALPLRQPIRMGDSDTYTRSRESFETVQRRARDPRPRRTCPTPSSARLDALFGRTDAVAGARDADADAR